MARRYEVTNLALGPRGFVEVGKSRPTILARGQTEVLEVAGDTEKLLLRMRDKKPPQVEATDLGAVKAEAPAAASAAAPAPAPRPAENPVPTGRREGESLEDAQARFDALPDEQKARDFPDGRPVAQYEPSMDFDALEDEQLRAFLKDAEVNFHPATGHKKLVEKALEADRAQWDEAQKAKPGAEAI